MGEAKQQELLEVKDRYDNFYFLMYFMCNNTELIFSKCFAFYYIVSIKALKNEALG